MLGYREETGQTQAQVARMGKCSRPTIAKVEAEIRGRFSIDVARGLVEGAKSAPFRRKLSFDALTTAPMKGARR